MINTITLIGRLTDIPKMATTDKGTNVVNFTLATNDGKDRSYFFRCVGFNELADRIGQYLVKGSLVGIMGKLTQRSYKDRDGNNREVIEILIQTIEFLSPKKEETTEAPVEAPKASVTAQEAYDMDDSDDNLPF